MAKYISKDNSGLIFGKTKEEFKRRLTLAALLVERSAKQLVPVETGTLKRSITHEVEDTTARVGSNVKYAPHIELGTSKMAAQPYLRPALEMNKAEIQRLLKK